jgi:hypothetical protein
MTMKAILSSVLFISLLISPGRLSAVASAEAYAAGAGAQGTRSPASAHASTTQQPADDGWPRAYVTSSRARLVIDEPLDQKKTAMYAAVPCTDLGTQYAGTDAAAPTVLVSQNPAELMLLNGGAAYTPVTGTRLERVSNTDSNVLRPGTTGTVYPGACGRWLRGDGYGARYSPWSAADTSSDAVYGPCVGAGYAAWYNPRTGNSARGAAARGPVGPGGAASLSRCAT